MRTWGVSDSLKLYNMENWGGRYFNINPLGHVVVYPGQSEGIDLLRVIRDIEKRGMEAPVLVRFPDIIRQRVIELNESFRSSIQEAEYRGRYQGVYPIKVNQMREVVEEILDAGEQYSFGLEAGSKAELVAVLAMETAADALIICNGYKDYNYIKTALLGNKLGKDVIIVVEKLSELDQIIEVSQELGVRPQIGMRAKLSSRGSGRWESSTGDLAKFGLTAPEILKAVKRLQEADMSDCFRLLHFHIGSQVTNIRTIKDSVKEGTRYFAKLKKMGLEGLQFIDVGGGLGVDYDGSQSNFESSTNYTLQEYVADVVYTIKEVCQAEKVDEPDIVSETGRALVAHHSVLVVNVFGDIRVSETGLELPETLDSEEPTDSQVVAELRYISKNVCIKNITESYHDALQRKEEALSMFKLGILSLEERAKAEHLFWKVCRKIRKLSRDMKYVPEDVADLSKILADQYLCNFSLFQSMPDHWAFQQLFPIVPLHRLTEKPERQAVLADITCDSDGKVCKFIDLRDINDTLPVHELVPGEKYYLGLFLMGAYQDIMGDMHNLFGKVNEVHVFLDETEPGGYYIEEMIPGNTIARVLSWIQYSPEALKKQLKKQIDEQVREGNIKPREGVDLQQHYEAVLHGYTYMNQKISPQQAQKRAHLREQQRLETHL